MFKKKKKKKEYYYSIQILFTTPSKPFVILMLRQVCVFNFLRTDTAYRFNV